MTTYQFNQVLAGQLYPGTLNPDHRWVLKVRYFNSGGKFGFIASAAHRMALSDVLDDALEAVNLVLDGPTPPDVFEFVLIDKDAWVKHRYNWQPIQNFEEFVDDNIQNILPS